MTEQLDKDNLFRTPIRLKGPSAGQMLMKAIDKESGGAGDFKAGDRECVICGFIWTPRSIDETCPYHDQIHARLSDAPPETAILNSQAAPKYSLKTQLWIGAWIFLSIASGVALGFMKGCR